MNKKTKKKLLLGALALTLAGATGCGKKADCDIEEAHVHLYTNEEGYTRYINKEYIKYDGYTRSDDYIEIGGKEDLYKFLDKNNLLRIEDNLDIILDKQKENTDYIEYRYSYTYYNPISHYTYIGDTFILYYTYIPIPSYSWTSNKSHINLTGEQRLCHYVYTAYKIGKDDKGNYVLIPSEQVDDITEIMDEYPYIKEKYYKTVDSNGYDLDYEDGPEEELTPEEIKEREENIDSSQNNEENKKYSLNQNLIKRL